MLGIAESLSIRVNALIERIGVLRSELFRSVLTKRYELTDAFDSELIDDVQTEFSSFYRAVSSWLRFVFKFKIQSALAATFFALVAAAVLLVGGRRVFRRVFDADPTAEDPSYLSRLSVAFWSTLLPTVAVGVFLVSTIFFFNYFNVLRGDIGIFLNSLFTVIGIVFCVNRLANAVLSPGLPNWRLISIESKSARRWVRLVTAMAVVIGVNNFLAVVNESMNSPLSLTIARSFVATVIVGVLLILIGLLRDEQGVWRPWRTWLRYTAIALGCFIIACRAARLYRPCDLRLASGRGDRHNPASPPISVSCRRVQSARKAALPKPRSVAGSPPIPARKRRRSTSLAWSSASPSI